jgi:zinc transport system substrate-binding protein
MLKRMILVVLALAGCAGFLLSGCQDVNRQATRPVVMTTLFPLYDFARTIAGDRMEVQLLLPPGVEPHHFEPRPDDLARIHRAALFIYIGPFMEPWADRVLAGLDRNKVRIVAAAEGISLLPAPAHSGKGHAGHGDGLQHQAERLDPHIWLDFSIDQAMVAKLLEAFVAADPAGAEEYRRRAADLTEQLAGLDTRYKEGLATCESRVLLHGGHAAFGYLTHRYNLEYQPAAGVTAELEATPRRLAELVQQVRKQKVKAIFTEELVTPRVARTIAGETGATVLTLYAAPNLAPEDRAKGVTFIQLMEENLKSLKIGLACRN